MINALTFQTKRQLANPALSRALGRFILLGLTILASDIWAQPRARGTIVGRVVLAPSGEPIARARIVIKSATDFFTDEDGTPKEERVPLEGIVTEAFTDDSGNYRLTDVPAVEVVVVASNSGMVEKSETVTVRAGVTVRRDFMLTRSPPSKRADNRHDLPGVDSPGSFLIGLPHLPGSGGDRPAGK